MQLLRKIYYALPPKFRFWARWLYFLPGDIWDNLSGKRGKMTPPKGLIYTGAGDFEAQGKKFLGYFIELADLQPNQNVLDVGSGIGRIAIPLTQYINRAGLYEGFDVVRLGVNWCQRHISSQYPNFNFKYVPLGNDLYRSKGKEASSFKFPYPDEAFDLVVLISVFTHMLPEEIENYLKEIHRVLKPEGRCLATFFIWNEEVEKLVEKEQDVPFSFPYDMGYYRLMSKRVKSANVALEASYLLEQLIPNAQLVVDHSYWGYWSGRQKNNCKDFQDIVLLKKDKPGYQQTEE